MIMLGTIINVIAILIGGTIGLLFGSRLPQRVVNTITAGLGLFTALIAISMFLKTEQALVVLGSLMIGALLGEWWKIEDRIKNLGHWLEGKSAGLLGKLHLYNYSGEEPQESDNTRFIRGFMTASLLFCIGPMTILGSIQDGLSGDTNLLAIKSVLDGFASIAFAASLGVGVLFSTLVVILYQGALTLLAVQVQGIMSAQMMNEMTAVGGVLLLGLALSSLLEIKKIQIGNFLPALIIAPIIVAFL